MGAIKHQSVTASTALEPLTDSCEAQIGQLVLDLGDRLGTEVADVEQVRLAACDELADGVDALALEGVGGTGLQVQLVDHEGEVQIGRAHV